MSICPKVIVCARTLETMRCPSPLGKLVHDTVTIWMLAFECCFKSFAEVIHSLLSFIHSFIQLHTFVAKYFIPSLNNSPTTK